MRNIENVFVNGISLVSKNETPAVEQAENRFALFKTVSKQKINTMKEIQKNLRKGKIREIQKNLKCPGMESKRN